MALYDIAAVLIPGGPLNWEGGVEWERPEGGRQGVQDRVAVVRLKGGEGRVGASMIGERVGPGGKTAGKGRVDSRAGSNTHVCSSPQQL
ncbi:hypothetical protein HaLaN_03856, partial [Haematococcus lacustris]